MIAECFVVFCDFIFTVVAKLYQREAEMTVDGNSPAQSRVGEKQEISCAESEGQFITPNNNHSDKTHNTESEKSEKVRKMRDIQQIEMNERARKLIDN